MLFSVAFYNYLIHLCLKLLCFKMSFNLVLIQKKNIKGNETKVKSKDDFCIHFSENIEFVLNRH